MKTVMISRISQRISQSSCRQSWSICGETEYRNVS